MADYTVKRFDEMEPNLVVGGIPAGVYQPPEFTELGGPDPVAPPELLAD